MISTKSAIRYAKALIEMAIEQNALDNVLSDMKKIIALSEGSREFNSFLNSPIIKTDKKIEIIEKLVNDAHTLSKGFIALIVKNGRSAMLPYIASGYCKLLEDHRGIVSGTITSAVALDADSRLKIHGKLSQIFKGDLQLKEQINPDLLGGFVISIGDKQIDASIARKIKNLRQELTK